MLKSSTAILSILLGLMSDNLAAETLTIAALRDFEPYSWHDGSHAQGTDIEMIREASERAGFDVKFEFVPWKRVLLLVKLGKVNGGFPSFQRPDREEYAHYTSVPLHVSRQNVFTVKDSAFTYENITSLFGRNVTIMRGYSIGNKFDHASQNGKITVRQLDSLDIALKHLVGGRYDIFINNDLPTLYRATQIGLRNQISLKSPPINPGEGAFLIFSKASLGHRGKTLTQKFDDALKSMRADGTIQSIIASYVR